MKRLRRNARKSTYLLREGISILGSIFNDGLVRRIIGFCFLPLIITLIIIGFNANDLDTVKSDTEVLGSTVPIATNLNDAVDIEVSLFVTDIEPPEINEDYFNSTFWLIVAYDEELKFPMSRITFPKSKNIVVANPSETLQGSRRFSLRRVSGSFRHDWELSKFPFDKQELDIYVSLPNTGDRQYNLKPLGMNKELAEEVRIKGWNIVNVSSQIKSVGTPITLKHGKDDVNKVINYSYLKKGISVQRTSRILIWKLVTGAYAAFMISLSYYFLKAENTGTLSARFSILTGSVFATIISMRVASSEIGTAEHMTLVDEIHIGVLMYTMAGIACAIITSSLVLGNGNDTKIIRIQKIFFRSTLIGFLLFNVAIFAIALS